jgi:hypothetical protein
MLLFNLFHGGFAATGFQKIDLPDLGALILRKYKNLQNLILLNHLNKRGDHFHFRAKLCVGHLLILFITLTNPT